MSGSAGNRARLELRKTPRRLLTAPEPGLPAIRRGGCPQATRGSRWNRPPHGDLHILDVRRRTQTNEAKNTPDDHERQHQTDRPVQGPRTRTTAPLIRSSCSGTPAARGHMYVAHVAEPDELEIARRRFPVGAHVTGRVVKVPQPGAIGVFVDLNGPPPGFIDLIHLPTEPRW